MCNVPWSNETERADCYQNLYNEQLVICDRLDRHLQRYIAEVEKLERYRDDTQIEVSKDIEAKIKAEAYKEFADRLKEKAQSHYFDDVILSVRIDDLDNLLEELVGDNND